MSISSAIKNQFRSVIQWNDPQPWEIFRRFTDRGDELKSASRLILQPGQGAIFTHEGKLVDAFTREGSFDIATDNSPFFTTLRKFLNAFESEHKVGLWFYRRAEIMNVRWGTRMPITYNDPVYGFPVNLGGHGNFSILID
ncbi:MAG: SPFH domain-containing protein, partial [Gallionellaceae bacterium]|nr:SPFH domain-containing protein [Gallionellaceae bacterium]